MKNRKTIIINGANGYVASNFIRNLLFHNYRVVALVRENKKHPAEERMQNALLDVSDGEYMDTSNLSVYTYSLMDKDFALPAQLFRNIFEGKIDYFHFAASLKYDKKSKDEIFSINVAGLENSIAVFLKYADRRSRFFYISTAYSCGKFKGLFQEKFYPDQPITAFRNYYEQSKRFAENVLRHYNENAGLNGKIIRLSQVVGNNKTGVTKTDYGIFDFAKRMHTLANRYKHAEIRARIDANAGQNLTPVNTVVEHLTKVTAIEHLPVIMHFTAKNQIKNIDIIKALNKLLAIRIIPVKNLDSKEMNALERIIAVAMSFTGNYTHTNIAFDSYKRDRVIFAPDSAELSVEEVHNMLEYFIEALSRKRMAQKLMVLA